MPVSRSHSPSNRAARLKWTAVVVCVVLAVAGALLGLRSPMLHQYEYQEDVYLALDGSASVYISASLPALVALYGMDLPVDPASSGGMRSLPAAAPFSADTFEFGPAGARYRLVERLGPPVNRPVGSVGWTGRELIGFRWHIPSRVEYHNSRPENLLRGNILVWEQPLTSRLAGVPLQMEVEMQPQSILHGALWLFATSVFSALAVVALILWWVVGRGKPGRAVRT